MVPLFAPLTLVACNETPARQTWTVSFNTHCWISHTKMKISNKFPASKDEANTRTRWKKGILGPTKVTTSIMEGDKTIACILETNEMVRKDRGKVAWTLTAWTWRRQAHGHARQNSTRRRNFEYRGGKNDNGSSVQIRWQAWNTPDWNSQPSVWKIHSDFP